MTVVDKIPDFAREFCPRPIKVKRRRDIFTCDVEALRTWLVQGMYLNTLFCILS